MRIAQVSPLYESVPPSGYGGTERVVSYLTEELVSLGHKVTLFASGNSTTKAKLVPICPESLRLSNKCTDPVSYHILMIEQVFQSAADFDIIHFHTDYLHFSLTRRISVPALTTLHGRLDLPELALLYREFSDIPLISISDAQREPLSWANWQTTVYHGLPPSLYRLNERPGEYLVFVGRVSPEKRVVDAIEIAKRAEIPLRIAAKVDKTEEAYFKEVIQPLLKHPLIDFIGEVGEKDKQELLGRAYAFLFPIDWPEPFGLAMIEAMACGTPVIARRRGSIPEIVEEGVSGFTFEDMDQAVRAVGAAGELSRLKIRNEFKKRFSARRMALDYLAAYESLLAHVKTSGSLRIA
ncbi:MAG: glycosyltransferase family 4 protein [Alphaproteobacteria bacterium]|uniref:Glycosyltransferase family 4 protein n=1 Tax=Candidatus Nitrobium versatile TaxID=2884831 RepID=A0A953LZP8_9BACT|nr:glycosyltransferase family 4 protein [Candidatus Nitrobium versatile]